MTTKGTDNRFRYLNIVKGVDPATPPSGDARLFVDSADLTLKWIDDDGTVYPLGAGGGSDLDTILAASSGQDIADALTGAAAPDAGNVFATMADLPAASTGGLLGVSQYTAGADAFINTGSTTAIDIDATNFKVTFTAPASGKVLVRVTAAYQCGGHARIGVRENTTNVVSPVNVLVGLGSPQTISVAFYITGVSAGSHTYKASWNTDSTMYVFSGPTYGAYTMEAWEAP